MIDHRGRAVTDAFNQRHLGGKRYVLIGECPVQLPPETLQDFNEIGGRLSGDGHSARHGRIEVMVGAHETGKDYLAGAIDGIRVGKSLLYLRRAADTRDLLSSTTTAPFQVTWFF